MSKRRTSFDVRIWAVERRRGASTTYRLRWFVADESHSLSFATKALADSERSALLTAARKGEAFDVETGRPVSELRHSTGITWWAWVLQYVDLKWPDLAPRSRRSVAEALITPTLALAPTTRRLDEKQLRAAMFNWAFNATIRKQGPPSDEYDESIRWLTDNSVNLEALTDPEVLRFVVQAIGKKLDGKPGAATVTARKRAVLYNVLELAVEAEHLESNPLDAIKKTSIGINDVLDPRVVVNVSQGRDLIEALTKVAGGPRLQAFFGSIFYAALRPSEGAGLHESALNLPEQGWGEFVLFESDSEVSGTWTDTGQRVARPQLKHRPRGAVRPVPTHPALTTLIHHHLDTFATGSGYVFRGPFGGRLTSKHYTGVWQDARKKVLTPAEFASPLVQRPYDLRHTAVSLWLAAGVDSTQVATWAGHSVAVLHRVYAHVISGREEVARSRIEALFNE